VASTTGAGNTLTELSKSENIYAVIGLNRTSAHAAHGLFEPGHYLRVSSPSTHLCCELGFEYALFRISVVGTGARITAMIVKPKRKYSADDVRQLVELLRASQDLTAAELAGM
jgi:hypothetical protein